MTNTRKKKRKREREGGKTEEKENISSWGGSDLRVGVVGSLDSSLTGFFEIWRSRERKNYRKSQSRDRNKQMTRKKGSL